MTFKSVVPLQYRESETDCCVGLRGYLYYFQDSATHHLLHYGKGNDTIPFDYGITWILTKYHVQLHKRAPAGGYMDVESWMEPQKSQVRLKHKLRLSMEGEVYALGEGEMCLMSLKEGKPVRLSSIGFDPAWEEHVETPYPMPEVGKLRIDEEGMEPAYTFTVRYCNLDNNHHMNNLHFVDMVLNAFGTAFHEEHPVNDIEIEFAGQCLEGSRIDVLTRVGEHRAEVLGRIQGGDVVVKAALGY